MKLPETWYDYILQCWIVKNKVANCGHINKLTSGCYACKHAGEPAQEENYMD